MKSLTVAFAMHKAIEELFASGLCSISKSFKFSAKFDKISMEIYWLVTSVWVPYNPFGK